MTLSLVIKIYLKKYPETALACTNFPEFLITETKDEGVPGPMLTYVRACENITTTKKPHNPLENRPIFYSCFVLKNDIPKKQNSFWKSQTLFKLPPILERASLDVIIYRLLLDTFVR